MGNYSLEPRANDCCTTDDQLGTGMTNEVLANVSSSFGGHLVHVKAVATVRIHVPEARQATSGSFQQAAPSQRPCSCNSLLISTCRCRIATSKSPSKRCHKSEREQHAESDTPRTQSSTAKQLRQASIDAQTINPSVATVDQVHAE